MIRSSDEMTASDANVLPIRMSERAANPRFLGLHPEDNVVVSIDPILHRRGG